MLRSLQLRPLNQFGLFVFDRRIAISAIDWVQALRRFEFVSLEEVQQKQFQSLQRLLATACENTPYYQRLFSRLGIRASDIRSPNDFERVPVLTKSTLQNQGHELINDTNDAAGRRPNMTGGSTGKPVRFYQDDSYWSFARASQWFVESWWGIYPGDRTASIWGCDRDIPEMGWKERLRVSIEQIRTCNAFALSESRMSDFGRMLVRWKPRYITGYASALELFSRFLLTRKDLIIRPRAVKSTAEVLRDSQRCVIEEAFQAPVYNFYGSREINNLAAECPAHKGMHANSLGRYIEIVDEKGKSVPAATPGRIVITDLTNFAMPFVRYQIEDIGIWRGASCSCGRPFPLIERVWGRSSDFVSTPQGKLIHGEFFTHLFYGISNIREFQVVQSGSMEICVDVVLTSGSTTFSSEEVLRQISQAMGSGVQCRLRVVDRIERPSSGKHRFTISHVPTSWGRTVIPSPEKTGP